MAGLGAVFMLGVTMGLGPCALHQMAVVVPFVGAARSTARSGLAEALAFSLSRTAVYGVLCMLAAAGARLASDLSGSPFPEVARAVLGLLLVLLSVGLLFRGQGCPGTGPGRAMVAAGALTALTPCPGVLAVVAYAASEGAALTGLAVGLAFGTGTSLSPLLVIGPAAAWLGGSGLRFARALRIAAAVIMFTLGVSMAIPSLMGW